MSGKPLIASTIGSYRKRRKQLVPLIIGVAAILLVIIGAIILTIALTSPGGFTLFATRTPTSTITPSPTNTLPPTNTPTITPTPTETATPMPSTPYSYIVQEGDSLSVIAEKNALGSNGVLLIFLLNPQIDSNNPIIYIGQTIILPPPGWLMPSPTPWPSGAPAKTLITYFVLPNDNLGSIAIQFNSTVDAIIKANPDLLADGVASIIYPGQRLQVPVNLITPAPTNTPNPNATFTPVSLATQTPVTTTP